MAKNFADDPKETMKYLKKKIKKIRVTGALQCTNKPNSQAPKDLSARGGQNAMSSIHTERTDRYDPGILTAKSSALPRKDPDAPIHASFMELMGYL